ncbi:MAG TPA: histidine phosphatase family protein [Longimicrobiales bacterium]|nr:histidine phosphatase family protein [Longimicrobiales bacterium]
MRRQTLMQRIYFVRHGQSEWNAIQRFQGQWNSDLSELGRRQAEQTGRLLADLGIQALFASPLDRARQTAEIVNRHLRLPVAFDDRIKEWDCGDWSGHLREDVLSRWPQEWAARQADMFHYRGPKCENYPDMFERARPFVAELERHEAERIAVVSHGMIGKVMIAILLDLDERQTLAIHQANDVAFSVTTGEAREVQHYQAGEGPFPGLVTHAD